MVTENRNTFCQLAVLFEGFIKHGEQGKEAHVNHSPKGMQKRIEWQM